MNFLRKILSGFSSNKRKETGELFSYRFGFAMVEASSNPNTETIKDWNSISVKKYVIFSDPKIPNLKIISEKGIAVLVGDAFVSHGEKVIEEVIKDFIDMDDWDAFDKISGKFSLLIFKNNKVRVLHDPFGARTVYYRQKGEICISSHSNLAAELFGDKMSERTKSFIKLPEYSQRGTGYLPGDLTMYDNIKSLIPNNYLDVTERKTVRYWPRQEIRKTTIEDFLKECDEYFYNLSRFIDTRYVPLLGLTGGVDTRALIAGLKAYNSNIKLITWTGHRLPKDEEPVVDEMITHLGYPHSYLNTSEVIESERFQKVRNVASIATGNSRGGSKLTAHMDRMNYSNEVFVRGFGGEILRGFYNRHKLKLSSDLVFDFYSMYKTKKVKEPSEEFEKFVYNATEGFIERANYQDNLFNIDIRDLFYWEQRMGVWAANMLNEMDPVVYSITGINSRPLYEAAFGLDEKDRIGESLMLKITSRYDDKFSKIGVVS